MIVSIPSAGRSSNVQTLALIAESNLEPDTYLLVPAVEEAQYRKHNPSAVTIVPLPYDPTVIPPTGQAGLVATARNLWTAQHAVGTRLTWLDDDLRVVRQLNDGNLVPVLVTDVIDLGWRLATDADVTLWGVYPVDNAYFMRVQPTVGLVFCIGQFYGVEVTGLPEVDQVTVWGKEDYERTLRHFMYRGAVARLNDVVPDSPTRSGGGGLQVVANRLERELDQIRYLQEKFPGLVATRRRKNGYPEIRLVQSPSKDPAFDI